MQLNSKYDFFAQSPALFSNAQAWCDPFYGLGDGLDVVRESGQV